MGEEERIEEEVKEVLERLKVPYSVEIVIVDDESGKVVFRWRRGRGNLVKGMQKTIEVLDRKMGIPMKDLLK
ncbi:MAG: hypothetical protein DRN68_05670 [Thaumarchaeota archaeon]|nr:MAG: hypothetical protein DRN68_05670 [Nitrososphaerota archaeon]